MDNKAVLAIDLGSAYTKIAVREGWSTKTALVQGLRLAPKDLPYCVPSAIAKVNDGAAESWLIGVDAASLRPGAGVAIFSNWKAGLFSKTGKGQVLEGTNQRPLTHEECVALAVRFFRQLREEIRHLQSDDDLMAMPVRVSVPNLDNGISADELITRILQEAGWQPARNRPSLFEPESNALGLLTRGKNDTWNPPGLPFSPLPGRSVYLPHMFESHMMRAFREGGMGDQRARYGVLVTDIGAFTTDFGFVCFDSSVWTKDDWNKPDVTTQSVDLGIRELDRTVVQTLSAQGQSAVKGAPIAEWENHKVELYAGSPQQLRAPNQQVVTVGAGHEKKAIQEAIRAFADKVWSARVDFIRQVPFRVHAETLSGGGAMISTIRAVLVERMRRDEGRIVHDLIDPAEPSSVLGDASQRDLDKRRRANLELIRGGSAVGGCSVFFE